MLKRFVEFLLTPRRRKHPMTASEIDIRNAPNPNRRRLTTSLPIDPEDIKRLLPEPLPVMAESVAKRFERMCDANMIALVKGEPLPYEFNWSFDDDVCPYCGHEIEDDEQ